MTPLLDRIKCYIITLFIVVTTAYFLGQEIWIAGIVGLWASWQAIKISSSLDITRYTDYDDE